MSGVRDRLRPGDRDLLGGVRDRLNGLLPGDLRRRGENGLPLGDLGIETGFLFILFWQLRFLYNIFIIFLFCSRLEKEIGKRIGNREGKPGKGNGIEKGNEVRKGDRKQEKQKKTI